MRATLERGWEMREVKVNKKELLDTVRKNLDNHVKDYNEAVEAYKEDAKEAVGKRKGEVIAEFDKLLKNLENKPVSLSVPLTLSFTLKVPVSHEKDYLQVVKMLEMSIDEVIALKSDEFACYVMDDWIWKEEFLATNSSYSSKKY